MSRKGGEHGKHLADRQGHRRDTRRHRLRAGRNINRYPDIHPPAKPPRTALKTESRILYLSGTRPHQINP